MNASKAKRVLGSVIQKHMPGVNKVATSLAVPNYVLHDLIHGKGRFLPELIGELVEELGLPRKKVEECMRTIHPPVNTENIQNTIQSVFRARA